MYWSGSVLEKNDIMAEAMAAVRFVAAIIDTSALQ